LKGNIVFDPETTILALRTTAFISTVLFAVAYAFSNRKAWLGFVLIHFVHLAFILWYVFGLDHPQTIFNIVTAFTGYGTILVLAVADAIRPGRAMQWTWGLHIIWFHMLFSFIILIEKHWGDDLRVHSWIGVAILITSLMIRFRFWQSQRLVK
jgi:hypothetical protein